jgi:hypothetical protein
MNLKSLAPFAAALALGAQAPRKQEAAKPAPAPAKAPQQAEAPKETLEARFAKETFVQVLNAVNDGWFGAPFKDINAVELNGTLSIALSAAAVNAKVSDLSQGQIKASGIKSGHAVMRVKSTYFANADFKTDFTGDFGTVTATRIGNKGYIYSKEQNAYTTRVDLPPSDAPLTYMSWFRSLMNDIKAVYVDSSTFRASLGKEETVGGKALQTVSFYAPTSAYDPKKREQSIAETLGFWKRGRLNVAFEKSTKLPWVMEYSNESQGVRTRMDFNYNASGKLYQVVITNSSKGFEGPGSLRLTYAPNGLITNAVGEIVSQQKKIAFDVAMNWTKDKKSGSIASVPPPNAKRMGREELEGTILVATAGNIMELQRQGLNFMAPKLAGK